MSLEYIVHTEKKSYRLLKSSSSKTSISKQSAFARMLGDSTNDISLATTFEDTDFFRELIRNGCEYFYNYEGYILFCGLPSLFFSRLVYQSQIEKCKRHSVQLLGQRREWIYEFADVELCENIDFGEVFFDLETQENAQFNSYDKRNLYAFISTKSSDSVHSTVAFFALSLLRENFERLGYEFQLKGDSIEEKRMKDWVIFNKRVPVSKQQIIEASFLIDESSYTLPVDPNFPNQYNIGSNQNINGSPPDIKPLDSLHYYAQSLTDQEVYDNSVACLSSSNTVLDNDFVFTGNDLLEFRTQGTYKLRVTTVFEYSYLRNDYQNVRNAITVVHETEQYESCRKIQIRPIWDMTTTSEPYFKILVDGEVVEVFRGDGLENRMVTIGGPYYYTSDYVDPENDVYAAPASDVLKPKFTIRIDKISCGPQGVCPNSEIDMNATCPEINLMDLICFYEMLGFEFQTDELNKTVCMQHLVEKIQTQKKKFYENSDNWNSKIICETLKEVPASKIYGDYFIYEYALDEDIFEAYKDKFKRQFAKGEIEYSDNPQKKINKASKNPFAASYTLECEELGDLPLPYVESEGAENVTPRIGVYCPETTFITYEGGPINYVVSGENYVAQDINEVIGFFSEGPDQLQNVETFLNASGYSLSDFEVINNGPPTAVFIDEEKDINLGFESGEGLPDSLLETCIKPLLDLIICGKQVTVETCLDAFEIHRLNVDNLKFFKGICGNNYYHFLLDFDAELSKGGTQTIKSIRI